MKNKQLRLAAIVATCVAGVFFLWHLPTIQREMTEKRYRSMFLEVPGVESVERFLDYEGFTIAGLNLKGGGHIGITRFDHSAFRSTNFISLENIGDILIVCKINKTEPLGRVSGAFNIIEVMQHSPLELDMNSIGDLVDNYQGIYNYIQQNFPEGVVNAKQLKIGKSEYWCHIKKDSVN